MSVTISAIEGAIVNQQYANTPSAAADVVGIFDANFNQLFEAARPLKAAVKETTKLMKHPVETGYVTTDHMVVQPIQIALPLLISSDDYYDTYYDIKTARLAGTIVNVLTKTDLYQNMLIANMPHEEDPEKFDAITIMLQLEEVRVVTAKTAPLPDAPNNKGSQNGKTASAGNEEAATQKTAKSSAAYSLIFGKSSE